jgi:uncharacterized membrane protein
MKSKAAIGNHPIHPMIVPIPIGAFFLALVGDVMFAASPEDRFWYSLSSTCIGIGLIFAVVAAVFGAIDYLGVRMSSRTFRLATWHALVNTSATVLYAASFLMRRVEPRDGATGWGKAATVSALGFLLLAAGGWLGGKLAYEHRVGVVEAEAQPPSSGARMAS